MTKTVTLIVTVAMCVVLLWTGTPDMYAEAVETLTVTYEFTGENSSKAGYAEGVITVIPSDKSYENGFYELYFADDNGILEDYKYIARLKITQEKVEYKMAHACAIPEGATKITVNAVEEDVIKESASVIIPENKRFSSGKEELKFASLSDIHINYQYSDRKWLEALNYFEQTGIDLICISGDYTNSGLDTEFAKYASVIEQSDYTGKIWAAIGNHDTGSTENYLKYMSSQGNDGKLYFHKIADNGDLFIFMAQDKLTQIDNSSIEDCFSTEQLDWLEALLEEYSSTGVNIFIYEHANFLNWGPGDVFPGVYVQPLNIRPENTNIMRFKAILDEYKEVIMCSGHTHAAFSEMVNYDDNNGTSARLIHNSSTSQIRVFNEDKSALIYNTNEIDSEGYIVTVYENDIVYRGMDLSKHLYIPTACYIMESVSTAHSSTENIRAIKVDEAQTKSYCFVGDRVEDIKLALTVEYEDGSIDTVYDGYNILLYNTDETIMVNREVIDESVESLFITYGGRAVMQDITVLECNFLSYLEGKGTKEAPYIIKSAEDFYYFTKACSTPVKVTSDGINVLTENAYFEQAADIDMSELGGELVYTGSNAMSLMKYCFAGVYDGKGHEIRTDLSLNSGSGSVFPYLTGTVINVRFTGERESVTGKAFFSPFKEISATGKVINCISEINYSGGTVYGLAQEVYGTVCNYYSTGNAVGKTVYPLAEYCSGKLGGLFNNVTDFEGNSYECNFSERKESMNDVKIIFNNAQSEGTLLANTVLEQDGLELFEWETESSDDVSYGRNTDLTPIILIAAAIAVILTVITVIMIKKKNKAKA